VDDLPRLLTSANQLFFQGTHDASYATTVFCRLQRLKLAILELRHLPPLLVRAGGSLSPDAMLVREARSAVRGHTELHQLG